MSQETWGFPATVESVVKVRENGPLIATAAVLHIPDGAIVVDMTYGRGMFWTKYRPEHLIEHDLYRGDGVDFRDLPEADGSVDVAVFDPPYLPNESAEKTTVPDFRDRYGIVLTSEQRGPRKVQDVADLYTAGIGEAHRVLKPRGRLLVKTMDFVNGGKYHAMRQHVVATATELGMAQVDEFVHHSGLGVSNLAGTTQRTSRRTHSFLCVFKK